FRILSSLTHCSHFMHCLAQHVSHFSGQAQRKLQGHYHYYGVRGNAKSLWKYQHLCQRLVFKWLNRRSQRRSYNWHGFREMWKSWGMPAPRMVEGALEPQTRLQLSYGYT
ncbi:MAG: hypothetical protein O3C43_15100, partial [Verrucomicrobia bacterium]|nr:hypothetical protein [Verrucomicrobiota bacterium]